MICPCAGQHACKALQAAHLECGSQEVQVSAPAPRAEGRVHDDGVRRQPLQRLEVAHAAAQEVDLRS